MPRKSIPPLSGERKQQLDAGLIKFPNAQDTAYILRIERKTLKDWVRRDRDDIAKIAMRIGGDIIFEYDELIDWMKSFKGVDPEIAKKIERAVA